MLWFYIQEMNVVVDRMIFLKEKYSFAEDPQSKDLLQRQISAMDAQIDRLVYGLYGLTEEEAKSLTANNLECIHCVDATIDEVDVFFFGNEHLKWLIKNCGYFVTARIDTVNALQKAPCIC